VKRIWRFIMHVELLLRAYHKNLHKKQMNSKHVCLFVSLHPHIWLHARRTSLRDGPQLLAVQPVVERFVRQFVLNQTFKHI